MSRGSGRVTPRVIIRKRHGMWEWRCELCWPATVGRRIRWADIIRISLPGHFARRMYHHAWAVQGGQGRRLARR